MSYSPCDFLDDVAGAMRDNGFIAREEWDAAGDEEDGGAMMSELCCYAIERAADCRNALAAVLGAWSFISEGDHPYQMREAIHQARVALSHADPYRAKETT